MRVHDEQSIMYFFIFNRERIWKIIILNFSPAELKYFSIRLHLEFCIMILCIIFITVHRGMEMEE